MINLLDIHVANLIAAGEVVDRPASALKELIENAVDAGAGIITAEIKGGGREYIRVTDNGEGMGAEDLGRSILRHATSKIKSEADLEKISTLGFRGEALAAISSVTDIKIFTKARGSQTGWLLEASSGQGASISEAGCPDGTTVVTERMFAKVPARQKFLKRDATEGMYCKWVVEKAAVANPGVSFKFIQDGKQKIFTPGNSSLIDAIYAVFGGEVADNLLRVEELETSGVERVSVSGYISRIDDGRKTRAEEHFFVNGRHVYSKTVMSALEEAYKSLADTGRFPFCVLNIRIDEASIDINVHPQKREIKFSDEKKIYSAVYYAVRNALELSGGYEGDEYEDEDEPEDYAQGIGVTVLCDPPALPAAAESLHGEESLGGIESSMPLSESAPEDSRTLLDDYRQSEKIYNLGAFDEPAGDAQRNYRILGEAFYGYILLEKGRKIIIIDKHAAHERIIYDIILERAAENKISAQALLAPLEIKLNAREAAGILNIEQDLRRIGFEFEWRGDDIMLGAVPSELAGADIAGLVKEAAYVSADGEAGAVERLAALAADKYAACRAALKAGVRDKPGDIIWLADRVMSYEGVRYCPHGRPVAFELAREEIEKRFGR